MNRKMPHDKCLLLIVLALLAVGLVVVFSASSVVSKELYGSGVQIFLRQAIFVVFGIGALIAVMSIDYHFYNRKPVIYGLLGITALLLLVTLLLPEANGARRWIRVGPLNFQPSEFAKLTVIFFCSYHLAQEKGLRSWNKKLLGWFAAVGSIVGLILIEPDLGTAACIAVAAGILLYLSGLPYRYTSASVLIALPTVYLLIAQVPYRRHRLLAFLDPQRDPLGTGYQIRQSLITIGSGGWTGVGYAEGKQKLFFLPEPHTDFVYSVIGEEVGLVGCGLVLVLFGLFFWRGVQVALRSDSSFGALCGLGIVCMIAIQALINMSVAVSLLPTKGMPLPFISAGGSSMLTTLIAAGVLLNISRFSRRSGVWRVPMDTGD
ncbi:MAG: putative lipid II flippase FtsW [Acidobacteria bacterium]|nr:putative lipid II flippase FtsW [Acidobacteriota bacterium]